MDTPNCFYSELCCICRELMEKYKDRIKAAIHCTRINPNCAHFTVVIYNRDLGHHNELEETKLGIAPSPLCPYTFSNWLPRVGEGVVVYFPEIGLAGEGRVFVGISLFGGFGRNVRVVLDCYIFRKSGENWLRSTIWSLH